ncbi:MAG: DNA polymerase III subunit beta [Deltaproteobacteria bacterium]|jgi:DNA polymerase-3 subunit beta|nr:DNA polymerase III subunit beta [Deltaproteobacteria bacterium]
MKLTIVKEHIIEGLQKAASIIPARSGAAYLRSLWLKAEGEMLTVMSTDANIEFAGQYAASVGQEGLVGVQGRAFVDLVRQLPGGEITLTLDDQSGSLRIEQGRRKYKLPVNDSTWFQTFSEFPSQNAVNWSADFFQEILERVSFCISDDDNTDAIGCLYIKSIGNGRIESCGLNGHQFALAAFTHDDLAAMLPPEGILIQKKYVQEMKRWLGGLEEIELNISEKRLYLRAGDGREMFSLPRSTYNYPDYMSFVSKLSAESISQLDLDRKECMEALGRLAIFATDNDRCTYLDLAETELTLTAQGQNVGSADESLEVSYQGDIAKIAFPTRNLMDVLGHFVSARVKLRFTAVEGPCGINGQDDPDYTVIIMPMKITDTTYYEEDA